MENIVCEKLLPLKLVTIILFIMCCMTLNAQPASEAYVVRSALDHYPSIRVAEDEIRKMKALERTAFNPEQPTFVIETPTDAGLGFEVEQELDFPTVYIKRSDWLKHKTQLAAEAASLTKNELVRDVRLAYLEAQVASSRSGYLVLQDSIWNEIANKSRRLYEAGEINKGDMIFSQSRAGLISITLANARTEMKYRLSGLNSYLDEPVEQVEELTPLIYIEKDTSDAYYFENYMLQNKAVTESEMDVIRAQRLPGLIVGYLKAPEPDTEFRYRFKAGVTIPVWQGQYGGEIEASKIEIEQADHEIALKKKEALASRIMWENTLEQTRQNLDWFQKTGIPQREELTDVYMRLFQAGEADYALTLRNIADAFEVIEQYLNAIELHNHAVIQLEYLNGQNNYD